MPHIILWQIKKHNMKIIENIINEQNIALEIYKNMIYNHKCEQTFDKGVSV